MLYILWVSADVKLHVSSIMVSNGKFSLSLRASVFCLAMPPLDAQPQIFSTVSTALTYPECHIVEVIQYVALSCWLPSFSNEHLSFLHVFSWLDSSFPFSAE